MARALTNDEPRHRKRAADRKPFTIEWRRPEDAGSACWQRAFDWTVYGRYATAKARDQALADIHTGRGAGAFFAQQGHEFRVGVLP